MTDRSWKEIWAQSDLPGGPLPYTTDALEQWAYRFYVLGKNHAGQRIAELEAELTQPTIPQTVDAAIEHIHDVILDEAESLEEARQEVINYHYLLHKQAQPTDSVLDQRIAKMESAIAEIREIYAVMDGCKPETAVEGYLMNVMEKMWEAAREGLKDD